MGTAASSLTTDRDSPADDLAVRTSVATDPDDEAARLRSNIAQTRAEMGETIEALHGKLNPSVLKEQALDQLHEAKETLKAEVKAEIADARSAVREATIGRVENMVESAQVTMKETSRSIASVVRDNPLPAALVGIGLAWLYMGSSRRRSGNGEHVSGGLQRAAGNVKERVGHLTEQAGQLAEQAQSTIGMRAQEASEAVTQAARQVEERGRRLENRAEQVFYENPLAIGAAAIAVGTVVGLAVPISRKEDEWMGKARDQVVQKAQELAHDALGKVENVARDVGDGVTRTLTAGEQSQQTGGAQSQQTGGTSQAA